MSKIGLTGFGRVKLFPVLKNDSEGYKVGESFDLPWAQSMTTQTDASENKIYGDDALYLSMKSWNGINSTLTVIEMPLAAIARLGFGSYNEESGTLEWKPQGENREFAVTFRQQRADGGYRMRKMFSFTVNEIKESGMNTKGDKSGVSSYQIVGTFTARAFDGRPGDIKDSVSAADLSWLDAIETAGE